ncbi:11900_t:CDS:2, partial [Gigaspora margarita]
EVVMLALVEEVEVVVGDGVRVSCDGGGGAIISYRWHGGDIGVCCNGGGELETEILLYLLTRDKNIGE